MTKQVCAPDFFFFIKQDTIADQFIYLVDQCLNTVYRILPQQNDWLNYWISNPTC